jgi:hypothetical protein
LFELSLPFGCIGGNIFEGRKKGRKKGGVRKNSFVFLVTKNNNLIQKSKE